MMHNIRCEGENRGHRKGPSSFFMQNPSDVFDELAIKEGETFLDLGCGSGDYSFHALNFIGQTGTVYAFDGQQRLIDYVNSENKNNIIAKTVDITSVLPLEDNSIDICLISTVLHALDFHKYKSNIFSELARVLKKDGKLAIIECKKEFTKFGPPLNLRISSEELEEEAIYFGFAKKSLVDLGDVNYMISFKLTEL